MLVLFETAAGFALVDAKDSASANDGYDLGKPSAFQLRAFARFENTQEAVSAAADLIEGQVPDSLRVFLEGNLGGKKKSSKSKSGLSAEKLFVCEPKLRGHIAKDLGISVATENDKNNQEIYRSIRAHFASILPEVSGEDMSAMNLGLSHSLSRYKLKFSPDKVDTMIVQAVSLLDDLDKELNTYAMRVREWYGWHFPEMGKIIADNILYAKVAKKLGSRSNASSTDLSDFLPEEIETEVKDAEKISMGTELSDRDVETVRGLCDQVIEIAAYREQLFEYLQQRMRAIAPNLTLLVGELVGARLIAHAGSLMTLAKYPASTVQILGAEKALFRALKAKHETPKYGLIYHASLVGQAAPKDKGKISRVLAAKASLASRFDALGEDTGVTAETQVGEDGRAKVEQRLRSLEGGKIRRISGLGKQVAAEQRQQQQSQQAQSVRHNKAVGPGSYNEGADVVAPQPKGKRKRSGSEATNGDAAASAPVAQVAAQSDAAEPRKKKHKKEKGDKKSKHSKKDKKSSKKSKKE